MTLPDNIKPDRRCSRGKFSNRDMRLSVKSIISKASRVAAKCSMAGMAKPRKTISRSPSGLGRCSAKPSSSADILIIISELDSPDLACLYLNSSR